jgi:hypothetical protein
MPELIRSTALYYKAGNANQLAAHVNSLRELSPTALDARRGAALERSKDFTWERTAAGTISELEAAVSQVS